MPREAPSARQDVALENPYEITREECSKVVWITVVGRHAHLSRDGLSRKRF